MIRLLATPFFSLFASCTSLPATPLAAQEITTPEAHIGRPLGRDFELADWKEVSGYFQRLGRESSRVRVEKVGETTEGRDFLLATISSEANLANLEQLRADAARIADPRGLDTEDKEALIARAKPFLFISIGMHSTETAAPQFGMEFAYELATSEAEPFKSAREEMVVLIAPCLNPDGFARSRENVGRGCGRRREGGGGGGQLRQASSFFGGLLPSGRQQQQVTGRENAAGRDLNRDFPKSGRSKPGQSFNQLARGRQPETV